jgi:hypothetical protein
MERDPMKLSDILPTVAMVVAIFIGLLLFRVAAVAPSAPSPPQVAETDP